MGALSLVPALEEHLPGASIVFASDNAAHPYGRRDAGQLTARVDEVLNRLVAQYAPDLLIVACNTASTVALPRLRAGLAPPVVGVVPAIKPAAAASASGHIALLATPATVERPYTAALIEQFAARCAVLRLGSSELVALAEGKLRGDPVPPARVREVLEPLRRDPRFARVDTVILGCTHFPLLAPELARELPAHLRWIDSSAGVARQTAALAAGLPPRHRESQRIAVFTRDDEDTRRLYPELRRRGFDRLESLPLPFSAEPADAGATPVDISHAFP